jgi:hypothetical protein
MEVNREWHSRFYNEALFEGCHYNFGGVNWVAATLTKKNLLEISDNSRALLNKNQEIFHSVVAKLLYVSKRGRLYIQLAVAFQCTRVSCSTGEDWKKLQRVLEYINGSLDKFLTIGADNISIMKTWVDASAAVHDKMQSQTGGNISFGREAIMRKSAKQKLTPKARPKQN